MSFGLTLHNDPVFQLDAYKVQFNILFAQGAI